PAAGLELPVSRDFFCRGVFVVSVNGHRHSLVDKTANPRPAVFPSTAAVEPRGRVRVSAFSPQLVASMRFVAVVVALVSCVHAAIWALSRDQMAAPDVWGPLASVSYAPFADSHHPAPSH